MLDTTEVRKLVDEVFEEEALMIGGLAALHPIEDQVLWRLMRSLGAIRGKAIRRLERSGSESESEDRPRGSRLVPHPAIEEFLTRVRAR